MKAIKYLEELIDLEQDYLSQYDEDEKPQHHVERLQDLKEALQQVKNCDLAYVGGALPDKEAFEFECIERAGVPSKCKLNDPRIKLAKDYFKGGEILVEMMKKQ
jgi:hypothetical protein